MMHEKRRWCVGAVATAEDLAAMLTQRTWTLCAGFSVAGHPQYLFLNDATHDDGAGEYGVVKIDGATYTQIESITFSWATMDEALRYIQEALSGAYDTSAFARPVDLVGRLDRPGQHGRCRLCE